MTWNDVEEYIQKITADIREDSVIKTTAIRDGIFAILEKKCTVIYYPLEDESNCGFHIKRYVNDKPEDFVYINTAKPSADQIFTAAHEFGHICEVADRVWKMLGKEGKPSVNDEEDITNWFAAELLMPSKTFRDSFLAHMNDMHIKPGPVKLDSLIRIIVLVMNDFMVPYESVRRRLVEAHLMDEKSAKKLLSTQKQISDRIMFYTKDRNTSIDKGTNSKTISGLRTLINNAENSSTADPYLIKKIKYEFDMKEASEDKDISISIEDTVDE